MLDQQARQVQEVAATEEPLVAFFHRAGRAASRANRDLLEAQARLLTLALPEPEERAALHKLTLVQAREEIRRTVGRHSPGAAEADKLAR